MDIRERQNFFVRNPWLFDALFSLLGAAFLCLFASTATSPLYPAQNYDYINLDSNYFLYFAELVLYHGKTPYLDIYDHKGMFHIFIDMAGLLMGNGSRHGVWALEILFTSASLFLLFRSIRLLFGDGLKYRVFAFCFFCPLVVMVAMGNGEGEWILPFASLSLYFYLRGYEKGTRVSFFLGSFFAGLEVGLALNSRPLDALWGGCFAVYYFVYYLKKERNLDLLWAVLSALLGCAIPFAVFIGVAYGGGYLSAMYRAIYVQSWAYMQKRIPLNAIWTNRVLVLGFLIAFASFYLRERKAYPQNAVLNEFFLIVGVLSSVLYFVIARFASYYYSGYTFYAVAMTYFFASFKPSPKRSKIRLFKTTSSVFGALAVVWSVSLVSCYYSQGLGDFSYKKSKTIEETVLNAIPEQDRKTEGKVYALNCDAVVYRVGHIVVNDKYCINQTWWAYDNPDVFPTVRDYLSSSARPEWLLVSSNPETLKYYGDVVGLYYQKTGTETEEFAIYLAK